MSGEASRPVPGLAWIDCAGGVAGDMLLGACLDALFSGPGGGLGKAMVFLRDVVRRLGLAGVTLGATEVRRGGFRGLRLEVGIRAGKSPPERSLSDVLAIVRGARLSAGVRRRAEAVFRRLGEAEAQAHGVAVRRVHLHEAGAVDAMVDVVGVAAALEALGVERLACSALPMGTGTVRCAHGELPLPAPAVARMLRGIPVLGLDVAGETVTPTGAALVTALAERFGPMPAMVVGAVGVGAGHADRPGVANLTRLFVGRALGAAGAATTAARDVLVEANIDDMTPDLFEHAFEALLRAGAADVFVTPILMKKGRPAHKLSVLVAGAKLEAVLAALFRETTSIGCRIVPVEKRALDRVSVDVATPWGRVAVKVSRFGGEVIGRRPEIDDCRRVARAAGVPLRAVVEAATAAALADRRRVR